MRERQWGVHMEGTEDKECLLKKCNTNFGEEELFAVLQYAMGSGYFDFHRSYEPTL